ncbi:MAG: TolC family protein [Calditrichaeota bacterium]|nr:TolC family protein [Calditrichota bacterium]
MRRIGFFMVIFLSMLTFAFAQTDVRKTLSLNDCIHIALKNNTSIVAAKSSADMSNAALQSARGNFLPIVDFRASGSRRSEEWKTIRFDELVSSKESYSYQFELRQPIFTGFSNYANYKQRQFDYRQNENKFGWTKQTVVVDVKLKYYNVLKNKQLLNVAEEALRAGKEELNRLQEMEKIGAVSRSEVFQQKVRVGEYRLNLVNARNAYINAETELNHTLGIDVTREIELVPEIMDTLARAPDLDFASATKMALANRLDLKAFVDQLESSKANVTVQKSGYFPMLSVFGNYNWWDVQFPRKKRDIDAFDSYSVGVSLSFNLFNGFKTRSAVQAAKARVIAEEANLEQAKRQVIWDVKKAFLELDRVNENLQVTKENIQAAEEDYRLASERYHIGAGTLIEQLTAHASLTSAKVERIKAVYDYKYAVTLLELVTGRLTWK